MNFDINEDQLAIRNLAAQVFADKVTDEFMLAFDRSGQDYDEELWSTLAQQGILGVAIDESLGGSGLGFAELCMVLEEQGRHVAPVPLYSSLVLGALPVMEFGTSAQKQRWLQPLSEGRLKLSAAIAELGMHDAAAEKVSATVDGEGWLLSGSKSLVIDGAAADCVVLRALESDGSESVFLLDTKLDGVGVLAHTISLSGMKAAQLNLTNVFVRKDALLGSSGEGAKIFEYIEKHANIAQCALQLGITEEAMKRTARYTGEREQFGVPIGSFQALGMRMADAYIDVEAIRSSYWLALWRLCEGLDARAEIRVAKWWACEASHRVVSTAQHLHGGIGADLDFPIHRFFLLAKQISFSQGNASTQLEKLGQLFASDDAIGFSALEV